MVDKQATGNADSDTDESTQSDTPDHDFPSISNVQSERNIFERVICAVDFLEACDIATIQEDRRIEGEVLAHAYVLMEFFEALPNLLDGDVYSDQTILAYRHIVRITFVIRLFEMRKAFRLIKRCRYPLSTTVKICWTDAVLANLSLFSVALASGVHPDGLGAPTTNSVKFQQWHNYFLAAAQLPESWSHTFSIITSQRSSPAAKKLAVHLLHAVYVLGSRLNNYDPWLSHSADPDGFAEICLQALNQSYLSGGERGNALDPVHSSILISLFANAHQSARSRTNIDNVRPLSLTCLLEATQAVVVCDLKMPIPSIAIPPERLNPGLGMLVKCSNFVPWCWLLWDDHRMAGFECIVYLSVIWLNQLKNCSDDGGPFGTDPMQCLHNFIQKHPACSLNILLQITLHSIDYLRDQQTCTGLPISFLTVLGKSVWAIGRIIESSADIGSYIPDICDCMLKLFFCLHEGTGSKGLSKVKEMILESLSHVDDSTFQTHVRSALVEMPCMIQGMVDNAIAALKRMLARMDDDSSLEDQISVVRSVMHFVVICWHKGCENCILRGSASTLLNLMAGLTSMASTRPIHLSELLCDLWTALTITSGRPNLNVSMITERQIGLWDFTVTGNRTSLIVAMSFANYLTIIIPDIDALRLAEAWDYLSGIFLMILQGIFIEDDEFIIIVSPAICSALAKLSAIPGTTSQIIASSPWTKSLADQLRTVLEGGREHDNKFFRALGSRLNKAGPQLLHQLKYQFQGKSMTHDSARSTYPTGRRLLYQSSCLLLIPSA